MADFARSRLDPEPEVDKGARMAGKAPKNREETWPVEHGEHAVTELLGQNAGAQSPFGDDQEFPLPVDRLLYEHPRPQDRPNR